MRYYYKYNRFNIYIIIYKYKCNYIKDIIIIIDSYNEKWEN